MTVTLKQANLQDAYDGSFYTVTGAGGDLNEWVTGYDELLAQADIGQPVEWFVATGADVNAYVGLDWGNPNEYPADLTFLLFPLNGLNVGKLALFKLRMHDRWFDDIVDNIKH